ncbi:hypothetical protein GEMMAAP_05485 [Gemmatimonas phototrophica]|uniref:Thioredoxin domain-containing protein n=2 Tax=Gemmatimonas phototrophica TaxID=1379270 RepID=A0A143BIR7_9BACT|nr:hypothetical protein GEMMAAP_05485 [Gemmatimonas phototrophica]
MWRVLLATALGVPLLAQGPSRHEPPGVLPAVTLRDQFDGRTVLSSPPGRPVVLLASTRAGKDAAARWQRCLQDVGATAGVRVVSVADLAGVPRLLRGIIRGVMPSDTAARVLLDWEGTLARRVRGDAAPLVAAAYGTDGRLTGWEALSLEREDPAVAQRLLAGLRGP